MKRATGIIATAAAAVMLAGLTVISAAAEETKTIKFFHRFPDEPFNGYIERKLAEYEEMHPEIEFKIESAQNAPYKEKLKVVVGGDDCPDIFFSWCGEFTERFIRQDLILDLTPYLEADQEWADSLIESQMINYTTSDGMVYGIPFRLDAKVMFYNIDMFKEAGCEVPTTWDEMLEVCQKLQDAGYTPICYGNQDLWPSAHYIGTLNQMTVSDEVRAVDYEPTTGAFTDEGYQKAMELYCDLIPYFNENPNGITADMARSNFCMEMGAMYYAELIEIPYISDPNTGLNADLNYGMFIFPEVEGPGNPKILTGAPEGFVVSSKTQYPDECVEFLKWFLGQESGIDEAQSIGWFDAAKDTTEGVTDQMLLDGYNIIMSAEKMGPWFDNVLYSTVCDEYLTAVSDLTNGDVTPEEAMTKIQAKALEAQTLAAQANGEE